MDDMGKLKIAFLLFVAFQGATAIRFNDFHLISHHPETGRASDIYIYAIGVAENGGTRTITKDGGLPTEAIETGLIPHTGGKVAIGFFGCFLLVHELKRRPGLRYGQYQGTLIRDDMPNTVFTGYTFVKPKSDVLNTRGVQTVTVYPSLTPNQLYKVEQIGVAWTPGCNRIIWSKGKVRNVNTGPRMTISSADQAGLYTIRRPKRGRRGYFVQILVIAATCPIPGYYDEARGRCQPAFGARCRNGGVLRDAEEECICPPGMFGTECGCWLDFDGTNVIIEGDPNSEPFLLCESLPGGNKDCKGHLFCYGDNYGCTCGSGWMGNACDTACRKGKWGANCRQTCPSEESDCNRFYGPSTNLRKNQCAPFP